MPLKKQRGRNENTLYGADITVQNLTKLKQERKNMSKLDAKSILKSKLGKIKTEMELTNRIARLEAIVLELLPNPAKCEACNEFAKNIDEEEFMSMTDYCFDCQKDLGKCIKILVVKLSNQ